MPWAATRMPLVPSWGPSWDERERAPSIRAMNCAAPWVRFVLATTRCAMAWLLAAAIPSAGAADAQANATPPNRLIHETSPYLLQHAYNPVRWFPWGEDAF